AKILADATKVHTYSRRKRAFSTGSGGVITVTRIISTAEETVSTAGVSMLVSTAIMDEEENQRIVRDAKIAQRLQKEIDAAERQRMAQVHQTAQTFTEDEWENIRARVEADEELIQRLQGEGSTISVESHHTPSERQEISGYEVAIRLQEHQDEEENQRIVRDAKIAQRLQKEIDAAERQRMAQREGDKEVYKFAGAGGSKRDAEEELDQGSSKKQKTDEASGATQRSIRRSLELEIILRVLWVELKRLFEPDADDELWKLQRYMHDPLTWRLYDTCGVHHVSTESGHDIFMLVEKDHPLTKGLMTMMLVNKL
nr:hypothetical protein [Tanacetum cinerariifolium]